jgi:hypothetical protein
MYAGMTNQSLVAELSAVLNGTSPAKGAKPAGSGLGSAAGGVAGAVGQIGQAAGGSPVAAGINAGEVIGAHAGTLPTPTHATGRGQ